MSQSSDATTEDRSLGWYDDPFGRHERRFFDGRRWTGHVADGTERSLDLMSAPSSTVDAQPAADASRPSDPPVERAANVRALLVAIGSVALLALAFVVFRHRGDEEPSGAASGTTAASDAPATGPGSEDEPLALGGVATVGEWEVSVLAVDPDGSTRVVAAGGPQAQKGNNLVIVHLRVHNIGTEPAVLADAATVGYEGSDGNAYDDELGAVLPSALAGMAPIAPGDEAVGTVVLEVPVSAIANGRVFVESTLSLESARTWWQSG